MAFPRLSASMLLASLILLLYWTTSSAQSHDLTSSDPSPPSRVRRSLLLPSGTRVKVSTSLTAAKETIAFIKERFAVADTVTGALRGLANIASWVPGIGTLVSAFVNLILVFIPQNDSVLNEVKKGFDEVNWRLDSLSRQISNLATDVEWFNYASVYSQDEVRILNAWKKFNEFQKNIVLVKSEEDRLRLAEIFADYYESSGTEISVANLYHYLTVTHTSLSGNLNELLKKKFKCDYKKIGEYNIYFSNLLWQGMVLNQFYWKLMGFPLSGKEEEHKWMFHNVLQSQRSALLHCLNNYKKYMKTDVEDITRKLGPDYNNKEAIAEEVQRFLDKKYFWYNWVVLVYNTNKDYKYVFYDMTKFPRARLTVAVGYTLREDRWYEEQVIEAIVRCLKDKSCETKDIQDLKGCKKKIYRNYKHTIPFNQQWYDITVGEHVKATHGTDYYGTDFVETPKPFYQRDCAGKKISFHYSRKMPTCSETSCVNGWCRDMLDTNDWMCDCKDGFYGYKCDKSEPIINSKLSLPFRVPDLSLISTRMTEMETKQDEILRILNATCPRL